MAKSPDARHPAKHSKKDPAKPTRAKAARPDTPELDPSLAELLNPAIGQGRAGVGSQTGKQDAPSPLVGEGREGGRDANSHAETNSQNASSHAHRVATP